MTYAETMTAMKSKRAEIAALQGEMRAMQAKAPRQEVQDYVLAGWNGPVRLSELFGDKRDLILIHNMGTGCSSCTMWADGLNGVYEHLASRAAFVVASPNPVATQQQFAKSRGWRFPMVSYEGSTFAESMRFRHRGLDRGYETDEAMGGWNPGVSVFRREDGRIWRLSEADFGPWDSFCLVYHLFDLVPSLERDWTPRYRYA
jgi:predicted dithiol-disulfide oxidoreductase (DUF899 family)